jgi:hypothetical protein
MNLLERCADSWIVIDGVLQGLFERERRDRVSLTRR